MRIYLWIASMLIAIASSAQELYVFTEPASNMAAKIPAARLSMMRSGNATRIVPELMYSLSPKLMLHAGSTFSDMHTRYIRWESLYLYGKYRFYSNDEVHRHFRMAAFLEGAYSRNPYQFDEINLQGDRSGLQAGMVATQLINKLAISGSVSHIQSVGANRKSRSRFPDRVYSAMNYTLSGGYLVLPKKYESYKQLNLNIYAELLAQQSLQRDRYYIDFAPALQLLFNSNTKLNLGYRLQVSGNQTRGMKNYFLLALEHSFYGRKGSN